MPVSVLHGLETSASGRIHQVGIINYLQFACDKCEVQGDG